MTTTSGTPQPILLKNAALVDGTSPQRREGADVLIEGGRIVEVSDRPIVSQAARSVDLGGRTLMPGLIDCHVHVVAGVADLGRNALLPDSLVAARAAGIMRDMLMRGFTTVRDVGGADHGLVVAVEEGAMVGPRLVVSGKALSQTGGHCDFRGRYDLRDRDYFGRKLGSLGRLADGVAEVRRAAREEIKGGAQFIKVMANGGIASPTDPIAFFGFSREELLAVVEEARDAQTYVSAHLYTVDAIRRAVECGVWSLEHCNLIDAQTAKLAAEHGAVVVPTLVTYDALASEGASLGFPPESVGKIEDVRSAGLRSLEILKAAGVRMGYGTDLLGAMHRHQSREFAIRAEALTPFDIIRSATTVAAEIVRMEGAVGVIAAGACADLIVVDGDPLKDVRILADPAKNLPAIIKAGQFVKNDGLGR